MIEVNIFFNKERMIYLGVSAVNAKVLMPPRQKLAVKLFENGQMCKIAQTQQELTNGAQEKLCVTKVLLLRINAFLKFKSTILVNNNFKENNNGKISIFVK